MIIHKENIRVEVEPKLWGIGIAETEKDQVRACKDIVEQIERHVDGVGLCQVLWDSVSYCEFCGYKWETDEDTGEPLCCKKAQDEWKKNKGESC